MQTKINHELDSDQISVFTSTIQRLSGVRTMPEAIHVVAHAARTLTGAEGATFVLRDGDLCFYADEDAISPLWKGSRFPMQSCISGWCMLNKQPAVINDIYQDTRIPHDAYRPTFVKSLAMVPIRADDPIGALGNYWATTYMPTPEQIAALQALADVTAVTLTNIQIQSRLHEQLSERNEMLKQLTQQRNQLEDVAQVIAHNLRAPISTLMLLADMVEKADSIQTKLNYLRKQLPIVQELNQTFDELVDAIQVRKDFTTARSHIVLLECLDQIRRDLAQEIEQSGAIIEHDFTMAPTAYYPAQHLVSILSNLMSNAIKFRHPDRLPHICITSFKHDGWTFLTCQDNGLGIDLTQHGQKLFRLRQTFHPHRDAKGFGLYITKAHVEAMGGTIDVESVPGYGSLFKVKLFQNKHL